MASSSTNKVVKGGYYASWANLAPSAINKNLFTHVYYAFLNPNNATFEFNINAVEARKLYEFNETLHKKNPPVETLFSVGGYSEGNAMFSNMASKSSSREKFIRSSIDIARKYEFDGIDLDWEYPGTPLDMDNMGRLLDEWRVAIQNDAKSKSQTPLLLTAAVYNSNELNIDEGPKRAFPSNKLRKNLDWINVMTYDYHGSAWEPSKTGAHAALNDPSEDGISTRKALQSWIDSGIPKSKLMMGLPLYGRTWRLKNRSSDGVGAEATGKGPGDDAQMTYAEIVKYNKDNNAKVKYDSKTVSAYSVVGDSWIGYDNKKTVKKKIKYARELGISGYFFWALHGDNKDWEISTKASESWLA